MEKLFICTHENARIRTAREPFLMNKCLNKWTDMLVLMI